MHLLSLLLSGTLASWFLQIQRNTHAHIRTPSTLELETFHHNLPQNIALNNTKTRAAEQSTNEQKKIPKSESSVCCYKFSVFLDHRASEHSAGVLQNIHTAALVHTDAGEDTQSTYPQSSCQSLS